MSTNAATDPQNLRADAQQQQDAAPPPPGPPPIPFGLALQQPAPFVYDSAAYCAYLSL